MRRVVLGVLLGAFLSACAVLHHVQVGDVDSQVVLKGRKFDVRVSEVGFSLKESSEVAKSFARDQETRDAINDIYALISLFQMGPRTGKPVFTDRYADRIFSLIRKECPSGKISGLTSVRETAKYPVVSGEIVRVSGYCLSR